MASPRTTLLFTGDSITDAGRRTDPSGHLGAGYVRRIAEHVAENSLPYTVINTGIGGDRSTDLIRRWDEDVIDHAPDVLTIMIGINDTWRGNDAGLPISADEYGSNYATIIEHAQAALTLRQLVIMEPFLVPLTDEQRAWRARDLDAKIEVARSLAGQYGALLIPLDEIFTERARANGPESVIDDGVHPSADGHELIAQEWWTRVPPRLL